MTTMTEEWRERCPECGAALIVGCLVSLLDRWPEILARYGFQKVAMGGGWELLELENTVPLGSVEAAECDAVFVGDLITPNVCCPRCRAPVWDVLSKVT